MTPEEVVQAQLDAYNKHDLDWFMGQYTEDIIVYDFPKMGVNIEGKANLREFYKNNRFHVKELHAELLNRIVQRDMVIDHEKIHGLSEEPMFIIAIYQIRSNAISKIWFIR